MYLFVFYKHRYRPLTCRKKQKKN